MLLLTGATGLVGSALLRRLIDEEQPVRCLVRNPRRLGPQRVRVQIALGDLTNPPSFRNAMRGVDTVVHLAASTRDQPRGSIEELVAMATWRMLDAAQRAGVEHFLYFSQLGASEHSKSRLFRSRAIAEHSVAEANIRSTVVAASLVYSPGDRWLKLIERLARLPFLPVPGRGHAAVCQPIWAEDVADCLAAVLRSSEHHRDAHRRYELAGPQTLTYDEVLREVLRSLRRERPLLHVPELVASHALEGLERIMHSDTPLTWDEAESIQTNMVSKSGTHDARTLGVNPRPIDSVLGAG
ncbi:MAG TPA: NAD(P)H-binding protein [Solirubrobacteraceae bacterium]|jgi:NADH dehydrogenase